VQQVVARAAKTNHSKAMGAVAKTILRLLMPIATKTFMSAEKTLGSEQRFRIDWNQVVSLAVDWCRPLGRQARERNKKDVCRKTGQLPLSIYTAQRGLRQDWGRGVEPSSDPNVSRMGVANACDVVNL